LAAALGVRQAFSHAYHHQANGRIERAGQQLMEHLRKINAEKTTNWVEAMPAALRQIHDAPGESGLSPYQILFGRQRNLPNAPYNPPKECDDAQNFFENQKLVDFHIAQVVNVKHDKLAEQCNRGRVKPPEFSSGDKVWYRRPENSGDKLDSRFIGLAVVLNRFSEYGYEIQLNETSTVRAHASFLKLYREDKFSGDTIPLYYHQCTVPDPDAAPDEWNVKQILEHRIRNGVHEFKVLW